jgi:uncharacterized protein
VVDAPGRHPARGIIVAMTGQGGDTSAPPGWYPDPSREFAWRWWDGRGWTSHASLPREPPAPVEDKTFTVELKEPSRGSLVWETYWVLAVFLVPAVTSAIVPLVQHLSGVTDINRFPNFVHGQPLTNMVLGILAYLGLAAVVPLTLFLLARTGQSPSRLGLGLPSWLGDFWPGIGLALLCFAAEFVVLIPIAPLLSRARHVAINPIVGSVPRYYVIYGLVLSAITAVTEEVMMNGYLFVRLEQLGWSPQRALTLSVVLRTSYHIYYGIGVVVLIPINFLLSRSFQKHKRLSRPILAHFLYDAVLMTVSVLTA